MALLPYRAAPLSRFRPWASANDLTGGKGEGGRAEFTKRSSSSFPLHRHNCFISSLRGSQKLRSTAGSDCPWATQHSTGGGWEVSREESRNPGPLEPLEFPVYPEDTGWVRGCCSLVLPPLLGRQAWRPVELSRALPGALPDRAGERQLSLSAPFIAVTTTVHEAVNPSSPSSRVHEGRDPGCLFTAMSLPCIQWCLSHSNRSINICPING